jgi:hypothetical protein
LLKDDEIKSLTLEILKSKINLAESSVDEILTRYVDISKELKTANKNLGSNFRMTVMQNSDT